jgi:hypothetical protein
MKALVLEYGANSYYHHDDKSFRLQEDLLTAIAALEAKPKCGNCGATDMPMLVVRDKGETRYCCVPECYSHPDTGDTAALDELINRCNAAACSSPTIGVSVEEYQETRRAIHAHVAVLVQAEREAIAKEIEACCHCLPDFTERGRIDVNCECHDHADIARERSHA